MTDALYERYKDALRRGHVAAQRSRYDEALEAYGEAARLAPDRPLPLVSIGSVLVRLGKSAEAVAAFDKALDRAPTDEPALRGRTDALLAISDRFNAAETLDRLALALDDAGRSADGVDAARHALDLAESRSRRASLRAMVDRLLADPAAAEAAGDAIDSAETLLRGPIGEEAPPPEPPPPPFDAAAAMAAVEDAAERGDAEATRDAALAAARGHRAAGQLHAAIDACYLALATNPADPDLHLALAELYLDRGWRSVAADKLVLLTRLVDLSEDGSARERICELATRVPDDPRLEAICA
ncbi:MAG TPA: tetratricopeptide repeat protein [Candidatus Limnocylindrales bacterium]|nr:tetratricopeptide repeat protein [Candidatus Limnocylindrales bacterium]